MNICVPYFNPFLKYPANNNRFKIQGIVLEETMPLPCRVRLYDKLTGVKFAEVVTNNYGHFSFENLDQRIFFIIAHDPKSKNNAVIADHVRPLT